MSRSLIVDDAPTAPVASGPAPLRAGLTTNRPRTRRRFWGLLACTLAVSALCYPPLWQALLRSVLVRLAARHGCELTIGRMEGGPFDPIHLYDVHWRQRGLPAGSTDAGTDLRIVHAELTLAWRIPGWQKPASSDVRRLVLDGISGRWNLATASGGASSAMASAATPRRWLDRLTPRLVPTDFFVRGDDVTLQRNRYRLRVRGLRLSGERSTAGLLSAREVEVAGPGFENTLLNRHGQTLWQGDRLSLSGLDFGPGVRLLSATLDGTHLERQRLDWDCRLTAMGGEIRSQGAINFVHPRLALELAGSLHRMPVAPLARLLGFASPAGGVVAQGSFSFRGDPEDWSAAQMWLAAQATDFRWGERDWQNLELRATIVHRHIQVHRLELQQSRNRLSLTGECSLLAPGQPGARWWEAGFACHVDARLDDLHALAQLVGSRLPALEGRMSVNGKVEAMPGRPGINGYLNVEGSRLQIRGAPLDDLHATLLFRGDDLSVADLQATRGEDSLSGRGSIRLAGPSSYQGELHLAMANPDLYAPALAGIIDLEKAGFPTDGLQAPIRIESVFYGPDPGGNTVFLTFGNLSKLPALPMPMDGDWWGDHWLGLAMWTAGQPPTAVMLPR